MIFDLNAAILINDTLNSINKNYGKKITDKDFSIFSKESLSKIETITINNLSDISFLKYLPNLKTLYIINPKYDQVIFTDTYDEDYFNLIIDFTPISYLTSLENLYIENNITLKKLNLSHLSNLKTLLLLNNPGLEIIEGLDNLHNLKHIKMYGNNIKQIGDLKQYLNNTIDAETNLVDIDLFFNYIKSINDANKLYDKYLKGETNLSFAEKNGINEYSKISIGQAVELYVKLKKLLDKHPEIMDTNEHKIEYVFKYISRYIDFAKNELKKRENFYTELITRYNEVPKYFEKYMCSLHNSYNTYHFKSGNCEGKINLMRFMLSMLNVSTKNVHCHDRRDQSSIGLNHSLLRAWTGGRWLYFDPTLDADNPYKYYGKTYNEMAEVVDLPAYEKQKFGGYEDAVQNNNPTFGKYHKL